MKIKCPDCATSYEIKAEALGPEGRSVKCAKCGNRWYVSPAEEEEGKVDFRPSGEPEERDDDPVKDEADDDEAQWAADAEEETFATDDDADDDKEEEVAVKPAPAAPRGKKEAGKSAPDPKETAEADAPIDIESSAKRPKIIVNPDKFRRDHIGALLNWIFRRNYRRIGGVALFAVALAGCAVFVLMRDNIVKQSPDLASLFQMIGFDVNLRGLEFRNLRTFSEVEDGKKVLVVEGSIRNLLAERNSVPAVRLSIRSADSQEIYAWTVEPRTKSLNALDETRFRTILADPPRGASDIQVRFVERGRRQIVLE
jgi:predicted Zn finger-like uncharacterized protein